LNDDWKGQFYIHLTVPGSRTGNTPLDRYPGEKGLLKWLKTALCLSLKTYIRSARNIEKHEKSASDFLNKKRQDNDRKNELFHDKRTSPIDAAIAQEDRERCLEALAMLSPEDQLILKLYYVDGRQNQQIATIIGLSISATTRARKRAEQRFKKAHLAIRKRN
jgi:RNA polymerase sigma factor (sigma-70 family)